MTVFTKSILTVIAIAAIIMLSLLSLVETVAAEEQLIDISNTCLHVMSANATAIIADKVCLEDFSNDVVMTREFVISSCNTLDKSIVVDQIEVMKDRLNKQVALKGAIRFCSSLRSTEHLGY